MNREMNKYIEQLRRIIQENNYLDTLAGQRFREWWPDALKDVIAVIAFAGRSKNRTGYKLPGIGSESDGDLFITHLLVDRWNRVLVQISSEDSDAFDLILPHSQEPTVPVENFSEEYLKEWTDLLT